VELTGLDKFDFDAGLLCLDFANTANWHASAHPTEYLETYSDLVGWGLVAGLLTRPQAEQLLSLAKEHPSQASDQLEQAIAFREAVYHILSASVADQPIPESDLSVLNRYVQQAMSHMALKSGPEGMVMDWETQPAALDFILWPVARSTVDVLTSDLHKRVGECQDDRGCGYLFLDTSRNGHRRWCSMESCGNRAKAQRHYEKARIK
jgi:predicted RNA-binding Zn ribbon-like protein